jgi:predicted ferric reductase
MNMDMPPNPAVVNLSTNDPKCIQAAEQCTAFYAAENASQAAVPWINQFNYGHYTIYAWVILVGLLFLARIFYMAVDRLIKTPKNPSDSWRPAILQKVQAAARFVFYRRLKLLWLSDFDFPLDFGTLLFILVMLIFFIGLTFAARPYYREQLGYGSPPIAIRADVMATACIPILVALSGKANVITLFTGISHERLNILHRWVAWICFALSLIHAIPYFIASFRSWGNGGYQRVVKEFYGYGKSGSNEYTGTPPLAILFGICVFSLPQIRKRFYEIFYIVHILLGVTFLGLMFWHAANINDTWAYLWATLAIWGASLLARVFWKTRPLNIQNQWFSGVPAILKAMPGNVTRIEVWADKNFHWKPSQHVFLRFISFAPFDNHPFTIASAEIPRNATKPNLVFLSRSHAGFTNRLAAYTQTQSEKGGVISTSVWVDGPYGGSSRPIHNRFDSLILFAGGTGISACLPWLLDTFHRATEPSRLKRVVLIWAIRDVDYFSWIAEDLEGLSSLINLTIRLHITQGEVTPPKLSSESPGVEILGTDDSAKEIGVEEKSIRMSSSDSIRERAFRRPGRPIMSEVLHEFVRLGEATLVFGCGPNGFRVDLANSVASAQTRVLYGECTEIALHTETYGW